MTTVNDKIVKELKKRMLIHRKHLKERESSRRYQGWCAEQIILQEFDEILETIQENGKQ